jgi:protein-S-isoprenylcysteine O-methyltransferase Ste14
MRASALEFRLRVVIMVVVIFLGFWSPWIEVWGPHTGFAGRVSLLEWMALELSRLGLVSFNVATPVVIVAGALIAGVAAALRIWGTAYLGPGTVNNAKMKGGGVMASGPYRYVRNPLYLGSFGMIAAICFLMPPTGAVFVLILVGVLLLRLILGEEAFLSGQMGESYRTYLHDVPRLIPRLRTTKARRGQEPRWLRAVIAEINPIGVFITLAVFGWTYNNELMIRGILVSFGISLVVRALMPSISQEAAATE